MSKRPDEDHIARIATHAALHGSKAAAEHFGVSERTVRRYVQTGRARPDVAVRVQDKKRKLNEALDRDWVAETEASMRATVRKLAALVEQANGPEFIHPVAGALKIQGELYLTWKAGFGDVESVADPAPAEAEAGEGGAVIRLSDLRA